MSRNSAGPQWRLARFVRTDAEAGVDADVRAEPAGEVGLVVGDRIVALAEALRSGLGADWAKDVPGAHEWLLAPDRTELFLAIGIWPGLLDAAAQAIAEGTARQQRLDEVRLLAPIAQPQKIVAVGLNYASHADEADRELPKYPVLFAKFANTLTGPQDDIPIPRASHRIDYEGELAVVIGWPASWVGREEALRYVAGYTIANDVSARDYQFRTKEMLQGKSFDHFCPLGPWITGAGQVGELGELTLTTQVNGEQRQSAGLNEMLFDVPFLVEYISQVMTLLPGDVILTGTPAGIGGTMNPRRWLLDGDRVDIEITGLGSISNRFVEPEGSR
jgi:acylpyruvate hydrolase